MRVEKWYNDWRIVRITEQGMVVLLRAVRNPSNEPEWKKAPAGIVMQRLGLPESGGMPTWMTVSVKISKDKARKTKGI